MPIDQASAPGLSDFDPDRHGVPWIRGWRDRATLLG